MSHHTESAMSHCINLTMSHGIQSHLTASMATHTSVIRSHAVVFIDWEWGTPRLSVYTGLGSWLRGPYCSFSHFSCPSIYFGGW